MIRWFSAAMLMLAAAGGANAQSGDPVLTDVRTPAGQLVARAMVFPSSRGVEVRVQAQGLAPGHYAVHLHAVGRCDGRDFADAGAHWNPTARQHGTLNPQGHHLGDLPNLDVGSDGGGRVEFAVTGADLSGAQGLLDADGAAIVIHARPDDYRSDPSGNSGGRIACGVLAAPPAAPAAAPAP